MSEPQTALSASRIKTAQSCSWLYWCKYKLKLPDTSNDGARRGSICHLIFEVLGDPRHRKHYDKIMKEQDIFSVPCVERLVMKHARREGVDDEENIQMIKEMTFNGLSYDFFGYDLDDPTKELSEQDFDIVKNDGNIAYRIRGFIDKLFLYKKQKFALIRDFKTSKEVFKGKDAEDNMQDLMYSLASQHLFPEYKNKQSEFLFVKFDLDPDAKKSGVMRMEPLSDEDLLGFEMQLTEIQKYLDGFSEKDAMSNLAARKSFPSDNSFSGRLLCGFAKQKGELKKDGNIKWHCSMKFDFFYYLFKNKAGQPVGSCFEEDFSEDLVPEGCTYQIEYYPGCPAYCS